MSTPKQDLINQLQATRQSAVESNETLADARADALRPPDDPPRIAACDAAIAKNEAVIAKCDEDITDAIVARPDFDDFMTKLGALTTRMDDDSTALDADVANLDKVKSVADTATSILSLFL